VTTLSGYKDLQKIKDKLRDGDNVERLLEAIGCEYIKSEQRGFVITAQLPERFYSTNKRAVQVKLNDSMSCAIRNRADFRGDIFNLISYIEFDIKPADLQNHLPKAKEFICNVFGWKQFLDKNNSVQVKDYTASLKEILNGKQRKKEIKPNPVLPEETMLEYYPYGKPLPYQPWIEEGISYRTQVMYGVGFDLDSKRVVFPLRNRFGQLVGVKGRLMKTEDDPERKYLYLHRCNNRYEWFNWHYAHPYILMEKKVYILEAEKSPMKLFDNGIYNALAIGASDISIEQADMIKQLGLDIEIVLCYDKGISIDEIKRNAELFKGRKVSAMFDTKGILEDKDAPIDKGIEVWNQMLEECTFPIATK
jgi:DNA primase